MTDNRKQWETKTFWGVVALFIAGGLEALGVTGVLTTVQQFAAVLGIPLTTLGIADRFRK